MELRSGHSSRKQELCKPRLAYKEVFLLIIGISAAVAALALVVLVIYAITLIQAAKSSLRGVDSALMKLQGELEEVRSQSLSLLASGEQLVKETNERMSALDPLARSVRQTGEVLEQVTGSVKEVTSAMSRSAATFEKSVERSQSRLSDITEAASMCFQLWQKWQSHKVAKSKEQGKDETMEE